VGGPETRSRSVHKGIFRLYCDNAGCVKRAIEVTSQVQLFQKPIRDFFVQQQIFDNTKKREDGIVTLQIALK